MTPFAWINIVFFAVLAAALVLVNFTGLDPWWLLTLPALWLGITVTGSARICSGLFLRALCNTGTHRNEIALTFDDGPTPGVTEKVLSLLRENNIKAAFFVVGSKAEKYPELIREIHKQGHLPGNHSFSHGFWFDLKGYAAMKAELDRTDRIIEKHTGLDKPLYFRPPYGVTTPVLAKIVRENNYMVVGWSVGMWDSTLKDIRKMMARFKKQVRPGAIVLLHDNHGRIIPLLKEIIQEAKRQGYSFARVDETA